MTKPRMQGNEAAPLMVSLLLKIDILTTEKTCHMAAEERAEEGTSLMIGHAKRWKKVEKEEDHGKKD